jgi:hypothetical protein
VTLKTVTKVRADANGIISEVSRASFWLEMVSKHFERSKSDYLSKSEEMSNTGYEGSPLAN